jgi:ATPase subunit of ABC transporter with duplicated ATPase domains
VNGKVRAANAEARLSRQAAALRSQLGRAQAVVDASPTEKAKGSAIRVDGSAARARNLVHLDIPELKAGTAVVARDVRCTVRRDSRILVTGENGCGKSTLLRALARAYPGDPDQMLILQQELDRTERDRLRTELHTTPPAARSEWLSLVACLGLDPEQVLRSPNLSPGEARKLALARALATRAQLLLLDEPVNHFDLPAIERLEQALADYAGALVLVSHDVVFAQRLAHTRWHFADGRLQAE